MSERGREHASATDAGSVHGGRVAVALAASVWAALVAGVGQGLITAINWHVRHRIVYTSRDVYWMAPISYLAPFVCLAVVLAVLSLVAPRVATARVVITACLWAALFSLTLPFGELARWASAVLTLGVSSVIAGRLVATDGRGVRTITRQAVALAALCAVVGIGTRVARQHASSVAIGQTPVPRSGAPNVLLIILDTVRSASMHLYGFERANTPVLDRLADSSLVFENAIAAAPWTLPSHASMFTGSYPAGLSANYLHPLDASQRTLAELLASHGYVTAGFVANHHYTGYDTGLARGFAVYEDYKTSLQQVVRSSWAMQALFFFRPAWFGANTTIAQGDVDKTLQVPPKTWADAKRAPEVVDEFLAWDLTRPRKPYFAFLNLYDAHDPRYAPLDIKRQFVSRFPNRDWYDAAIAYMDREVGRALDSLRARGELDNTVVIVASDHGELFGEHRLWGHANSLYLNVLRVPLIVRYPPRIASGKRMAAVVSLRDMAATISDLAGLPRQEWLPGNSLISAAMEHGERSPAVSFAHRTINLPKKFPAARGEMFSMTDDSLHYIHNMGDGGEELFKWATDPREASDMAHDAGRAALMSSLRAATRLPLVTGQRP
ncbi:MAG: sulfatase [Gemmatimonadaceae bacterium]